MKLIKKMRRLTQLPGFSQSVGPSCAFLRQKKKKKIWDAFSILQKESY